MSDVIRSALLDALALVLPVECAGCGLRDRELCLACRALLKPELASRELASSVPTMTALRYENEVRSIVLAFKEEFRTGLARSLAPAMEATLRTAPDRAEVLTVPTSRASFRRRGFDPVEVLVRAAGYRPVRALRVASTVEQKTLGAEARAANRSGSMVARRRLDGRVFVVVDDVLTTGATLDEAVRAVRAAGGEVVAAAALAFTPRLFRRPL